MKIIKLFIFIYNVYKCAHAQVAAHGHQLDREMAGYVLEDTRLSTLQRKLAKEVEPTVALALAILINDCILKARLTPQINGITHMIVNFFIIFLKDTRKRGPLMFLILFTIFYTDIIAGE